MRAAIPPSYNPLMLSIALAASILAATTNPSPLRPLSFEVSERWVDFGTLEIGEDATESVEVRNEGPMALEIRDVDLSGDDGFDLDEGDCERVLEPGESCSFEVRFEPEEPGRYAAEIEIETSLGDFDVQLSGEAEFSSLR